jgi:hypothetical protein
MKSQIVQIYNQFINCKNKELKEKIRLCLIHNAYTYDYLSKEQLNKLKKEV